MSALIDKQTGKSMDLDFWFHLCTLKKCIHVKSISIHKLFLTERKRQRQSGIPLFKKNLVIIITFIFGINGSLATDQVYLDSFDGYSPK